METRGRGDEIDGKGHAQGGQVEGGGKVMSDLLEREKKNPPAPEDEF